MPVLDSDCHVSAPGRYCNTCAFLMAPHLVPPSASSRAGGLMALVFQTASLAALALAFAIIAWQPPPMNL